MAYTPNPNAYSNAMYKMDTVEMGVEVSRKVLPKIFAKIAYHKGYMVNDRYNAEAQNALDVLIPKFNRPKGKFTNIRTGSYNPFTVTKDRVTQKYDVLSVEYEYNEIIQIAEDQIVQNVQGSDVVSTMTDMVSKVIAEEINLLTADGMISANLAYNSEKAEEDRKIAYIDRSALATVSIPDYIGEAVAKIGNADPEFGDTSFNDYRVSAVISNTMWADLMKTKNQFLLESSYGQELLIEGEFGRVTLGDTYAFKGKILGVYMFVLPDAFFPYAGNNNFAVNPTTGKVLGVMGVAEATERVFIDRGIKITDAVDFRGWNLQPLYRLGVACLKPWGTCLLVSSDFADSRLAPGLLTADFSAGSVSGSTKVTATSEDGTLYYVKGDADVYRGLNVSSISGAQQYTLGSNITQVSAGDIITLIVAETNELGDTVVIYAGKHELVANEIGVGA